MKRAPCLPGFKLDNQDDKGGQNTPIPMTSLLNIGANQLVIFYDKSLNTTTDAGTVPSDVVRCVDRDRPKTAGHRAIRAIM